jgi:uncharacterized protein YcbX
MNGMCNVIELGSISQLFRYPVKSLRGEALASVEVDSRGVCGDRLWALRDEAGKLGSGKSTRRFQRMDGLFALAAAYDGDVPVITFADGAAMRGDDAGIHAQLSAQVGTTVELVREGAISHFDAGAIHLCTTASLARLRQETLVDTVVDIRRFRPNLAIDVLGQADFVEDEWADWQLRIGQEVEIVVRQRTERCVMVGLPQAELSAAPTLLNTLVQTNHACLGVYADVVTPGRVHVGDPVRRLL